MGDNVNAKKKLEQMEKVRQAEQERKERIAERKNNKGIDISEGKMWQCLLRIIKFKSLIALQNSWSHWQRG